MTIDRATRTLGACAWLALALLFTACDGGALTDSGAGVITAPVRVSASLLDTPVQGLGVTVTGPGIAVPIVANIAASGAVASGTITVPAGRARVFTVRGFDAAGIQTHEGTSTVDVLPGDNPTVAVILFPLTVGTAITVTVGSYSLTLSPGDGSLPQGGTRQYVATVTTQDGKPVPGATIVWASLDPGVASINTAGLASARAVGETRIVASFGGVAAQATLTVGGDPTPGPGAVILLDMRQSLQSATTIDEAFALFGTQDHTPFRDADAPNPNGSGWSFTTNADGRGLHALRADWSISPADQGIRVINYFTSPLPMEVYAQWKNRLGKYAADADANGTNDSYAMWPESDACKRALFSRPDDKNRVDYLFNREDPEGVKTEMGDHNWVEYSNPVLWNANQVVGKGPFTTTVHVRAASADGVPDGIVQLWIDGKLLIDRSDVPAESEVFDRWSFPETCVKVPQPQSEYFWDMLVWRP